MNLLSCLIAAFRCVTDRISISNHRRPTIQRIRQRCRRTGLAHICITMSLPHCRCCRRGHFPLYSPFDWNGKVEIDLIETWTRSGLLGKAWLSQRPTREQKKTRSKARACDATRSGKWLWWRNIYRCCRLKMKRPRKFSIPAAPRSAEFCSRSCRRPSERVIDPAVTFFFFGGPSIFKRRPSRLRVATWTPDRTKNPLEPGEIKKKAGKKKRTWIRLFTLAVHNTDCLFAVAPAPLFSFANISGNLSLRVFFCLETWSKRVKSIEFRY